MSHCWYRHTSTEFVEMLNLYSGLMDNEVISTKIKYSELSNPKTILRIHLVLVDIFVYMHKDVYSSIISNSRKSEATWMPNNNRIIWQIIAYKFTLLKIFMTWLQLR